MTLELRGLSAGYGTHTVVRDVDLVVPDGAVVALLGPNGAGKTTLLRVASGMLRPSAGHIVLDGEVVTGRAPYRLARAGVTHIPEGRAVFGSLTVRDNVRVRAGSPAALATEYPTLATKLDRVAGTLSGGEQQMLALSRVTDASRVVLVDEVSMGLAPRAVGDLYQHLHALAAQGVALLLVEQYVGRALEMADYLYVLRKGRIEFAGEPGEFGDDQIRSVYLGA